MSRPLSFRRQVECLIAALEFEVESLGKRMKEAEEEMERLNDQSQVYAMKFGYREASEFDKSEIERILNAAKNAYEESTMMVAS